MLQFGQTAYRERLKYEASGEADHPLLLRKIFELWKFGPDFDAWLANFSEQHRKKGDVDGQEDETG